MPKKKDTTPKQDIAPITVDLTALAGPPAASKQAVPQLPDVEHMNPASEPAPPAASLPAPAASEAVKEKGVPTITLDEYREADVVQLVADLFEFPGNEVALERRVWSGVNKPAKDRVTGLRRELKDAGFSIADKTHANGTDGKLASAVYADKGGRSLTVRYGAAANYGHMISAS